MPIISDAGRASTTLFEPGREILLADSADDVLAPPARHCARTSGAPIGERARARVLAEHTRRAPRRRARGATSSSMLDRRSGAERSRRMSHRDAERATRASTARSARSTRSARGSTTSTCPTARRRLPRPLPRATSRRSSGARSRRTCRPTCTAGACSTSAATPASTASSWRGAAPTVLGIDVDAHYLRAGALGARASSGCDEQVEFRQHAGLRPGARSDERFDLVLVHGRPLPPAPPAARARHRSPSRSRRLMVFQTLTMPGDGGLRGHRPTARSTTARRCSTPGWPKMAFLEHRFAGDPTNWWAAEPRRRRGDAALERPARRRPGPGHEIYLCAPSPDPVGHRALYASQFASATGQRHEGR